MGFNAIEDMTFLQFCEQYGKLKDAGQYTSAKWLMDTYRGFVAERMRFSPPVLPNANRSRFEREDVV